MHIYIYIYIYEKYPRIISRKVEIRDKRKQPDEREYSGRAAAQKYFLDFNMVIHAYKIAYSNWLFMVMGKNVSYSMSPCFNDIITGSQHSPALHITYITLA